MSGTPTMTEILEEHRGKLDQTACYEGYCAASGCEVVILDLEAEAAHQTEQLIAAGYGSMGDSAVMALTQAADALPMDCHDPRHIADLLRHWAADIGGAS